jgi:hypothetical protein
VGEEKDKILVVRQLGGVHVVRRIMLEGVFGKETGRWNC